jgi:hypothetical protein
MRFLLGWNGRYGNFVRPFQKPVFRIHDVHEVYFVHFSHPRKANIHNSLVISVDLVQVNKIAATAHSVESVVNQLNPRERHGGSVDVHSPDTPGLIKYL